MSATRAPCLLASCTRARLGFELNRSTKYHIAWATPSDLLVNKPATKGWAFEGYDTQQLIPEHLFARLGVRHVIREYEQGQRDRGRGTDPNPSSPKPLAPGTRRTQPAHRTGGLPGPAITSLHRFLG